MADLLDVVDLATVQRAINVPDADLPLLATYITVVSRHIDGLCGPVVQRTITAEERHGGDSQIILDNWPVVSVTTVLENGTAVAATGYHVDTRLGVLARLSSSYVATQWTAGRWNVIVTYVAGRYPTTATVGALFSQAATMAVQGLWEDQQAIGGTRTFGAGGDSLDGNYATPAGAQYVLPKAAWMLLQGANELRPKARFA